MAIRGRVRLDPPAGDSPPGDSPPTRGRATGWLRRHGVTLAAIALIAVQLGWKAILLAHSYFRQDDYQYLGRAVGSGLGWTYLMQVDDGHLAPLGMGLNWVLARIALFNWPLICAVILPLLAAACLAMLRMLRTVFGNRPAILIPLGLFLFSPLSLAAADWWAVAFEILPLEIAMFMAIDAHVRYLRTGRRRTAVTAAIWLAVGLAASDKGAVVPLLLFALTAAFFEPRTHWAKAIVRAAVRHWRVWLWYLGLLAGYLILYFIQLSGSSIQPSNPNLGEPRGQPHRDHVREEPRARRARRPVAVVGRRPRLRPGRPAARSWSSWRGRSPSSSCSPAACAGWVPGGPGRSPSAGSSRPTSCPSSSAGCWSSRPPCSAVQTRYVTDATGIIALCAGLAFLPVAGEQAPTGCARGPWACGLRRAPSSRCWPVPSWSAPRYPSNGWNRSPPPA